MRSGNLVTIISVFVFDSEVKEWLFQADFGRLLREVESQVREADIYIYIYTYTRIYCIVLHHAMAYFRVLSWDNLGIFLGHFLNL